MWRHLCCKPSLHRHLSLFLGSHCSPVDLDLFLYQCYTDFIAMTLLYVLISGRVNPPTLRPFSFFFFQYCLEGQSKIWSGITPKLKVRFSDTYSTKENSRENEKECILMGSGWRRSKDMVEVVFLSRYLAASPFCQFLKFSSFSPWFVAATKQYLYALPCLS